MKAFEINKIHSILIIQLCPFGDVLLNTSYLDTLRRKFPKSKIDFLVMEPYNSVLYKHPAISEIVVIPKAKGIGYIWQRIKTFARVFARNYDLIIDQQCGTGSGQIVLFSGAKYRLGFADSKFARVYNLVAQRGVKRYSASTKFDILSPIGIVEEPYKLYYYIKQESTDYIAKWLQEQGLNKQGFICLSPGSPAPYKVWDLSLFAKLADRLQAQTKLPIVILWAPDELADARKVQELMTTPAIFALPTNLNQAAALLTFSKLLICNDGGINHISVATQTPSLAMFGPTSAENWNPEKVFPIHIGLANPQAYNPHDKSFGLNVEDAYQQALKLL
ncbi:MAG: glycosyltransferase family 9 protein [Candidatus Cloacimonas sp.]|jgi:ADP-heptose:LPS heptosyltransferase|nr:glycosyltransferase family 9 protein [Candidatus Cloacimonas sp.]